MKMPSARLREATSRSKEKNVAVNSRDSFEPGEVISGPRSSRAKRAVVIESGSEDEDGDEEDEDDADTHADEEEQEDDEEEEDAEGEDEDELAAGGAIRRRLNANGEAEDEEDEEEEGEDEDDAEGESDVEMADVSAPPPPPEIRRTGPPSKPSVTVTPAAPTAKVKSVEAKEMQMAASNTSDEELSDLESEGGGRDAEGEDVDEEEAMGDDDGDEEDAEGDSDDQDGVSRSGTPNLSKMTKRQRGRHDQVLGNDFLQLPMGMLFEPHDSH